MRRFFGDLFRDSAYDHRKILNSEDLIRTAKQMGYTQPEIAKLCGVSPPMVHYWGNPDKKDKPTFKQFEPLITQCGPGRLIVELEPLAASARELPKYKVFLAMAFFLATMGGVFWFASIEPCLDQWDECQKLEWYEMGSFGLKVFSESPIRD
ncbi:hypothetical protein A6779_17795 [Marinobacter adhaerens]|uniref:terminase gpP N-terminus-related DNA-binding protein n=1 Tax=Marinobacter adhaerens TaxID=1033846 RepID=UPI0008409B86|nr:hypothetical protein [Marinobacter adhaerens]ODM31417.1 hypothetical protein A6779_17795 [Marinobacter adhaerens]